VTAQKQRTQLVGVDDPGQAQVAGQAAMPDARRFTCAHVVVIDPEGDLADQVFGVGKLCDPQHDVPDLNEASTGNARSQTWQMSVGR
jgi:hypothetical protein